MSPVGRALSGQQRRFLLRSRAGMCLPARRHSCDADLPPKWTDGRVGNKSPVVSNADGDLSPADRGGRGPGSGPSGSVARATRTLRTINSVGSTTCRCVSAGFLDRVGVRVRVRRVRGRHAGTTCRERRSGSTVRQRDDPSRPHPVGPWSAPVEAWPPSGCRRNPRWKGRQGCRAPILRREHHAVGDRVSEAQHRRDSGVRGQQRTERGVAILLGGVWLFDDHRLYAGGGETLPPTSIC